ncbi:hypothetical protein JCM10213v2_003202 [Rhodosporidiobolus nylandii]
MFGTRSLLTRDSTSSVLSYFRQKRLADAAREQSEDFRSWLLEELAKSVALAGQAALNFKRGAIALALEADREQRFTLEEQNWLLRHVKLDDLMRGFTDYSKRVYSSVLSPHFLPGRMPFVPLPPNVGQEHDRALSQLSNLVRSSPEATHAMNTAYSCSVLWVDPEFRKLRSKVTLAQIDKNDITLHYLRKAIEQEGEVEVIVSAALAALKMGDISPTVDEARSVVEEMKEMFEEEDRLLKDA